MKPYNPCTASERKRGKKGKKSEGREKKLHLVLGNSSYFYCSLLCFSNLYHVIEVGLKDSIFSPLS